MRHTRSFAELCSLRLKKLSHVDVDATTPHAGMKSVKASTNNFTSAPDEPESRRTASALLQKLDEERRRRWNEAVQSIDFIPSSRRAWTIINNLTGHSRHPPRQCSISANAISSQLIRNRKYETRDRETTRLVREETSELWKIPTPSGSSSTSEFSRAEFVDALHKLKPGKARGPDQICPELILYAGPIIKSWLRKFLSSCLCQLRIPKVCRRLLAVTIPKSNKPLNDAKSYRPISFFLLPLQDSREALLYPHPACHRSPVPT